MSPVALVFGRRTPEQQVKKKETGMLGKSGALGNEDRNAEHGNGGRHAE